MKPSFSTGGVILAGILAAIFSLIVLGGLTAVSGQPFWMPLNVTTQAIYGPEVAEIPAFDLGHTGLGLLIHVISCIFWAAVAMIFMQWIGSAAAAGLGTALLALVIDYGILPERLSPGWHLALVFPVVVCGFIALGLGLWLGLSRVSRVQSPPFATAPIPVTGIPVPHHGPDALRHPAPPVIDQRQQRIDPANEVTEDPNRNTDSDR